MKILLLDDQGEKLRFISQYLEALGHNCEQANDIYKMKKLLRKKPYDVLIIDLVVPMCDEEHFEDAENGFTAIQYLRDTTEEIFLPKRYFVISRYLNKEKICELNSLGAISIDYDRPSGDWRKKLRKELEYMELTSIQKADIVILTVVDNERDMLKKVFNWTRMTIAGDPLEYYHSDVNTSDGHFLSLVYCHISKMGVVSATQATTRIIELFKPDTIVMCGIAAGRPGKTTFGDIIVAEASVNFMGGSIEETVDGNIEFLPDSDSISVIPSWLSLFKNYKDNQSLLRNIRDKADPLNEHKHDISLHIGKIATGPAVIKSEAFTEKYIKNHNRQYIAIDMETYGVYYAARYLNRRYISIKAVSDHADQNKNDASQKYAALISANLVKYFIENDYESWFRQEA